MRVTIFDTEYAIRSDDEALTAQLARKVDRMMRELRRAAPDQPPLALAVLTALNLAEQVHEEQHGAAQRGMEWSGELSKMAGYLDSVLASEETASGAPAMPTVLPDARPASALES